jgi:hypothetical protein
VPYQRTNFVTPAFPGYISGHSTFSRSAAEVMAAITGSPFFPGGMGTYTAVANTSLAFEKGPSQAVQLQWATYFDAADQAGLSRIWGGIHPPVDDFGGRRAGAQCGLGVWALVQKYFTGLVPSNSPPTLQPISDVVVNEGTLIRFVALASDSDTPAQTLKFSLDPGAPSGVTIGSNGAFRWRPTEFQGPGVYPITVRVTDNGIPNLSATQTFRVTVNEVNGPPIFLSARDQFVKAGSLLTFMTGVDKDWPGQNLSFTLDAGDATGASLDSTSGLFSWTPSDAQVGTYDVTVHATDDGVPPLSATVTYRIHVVESTFPLILVDFRRTGNSVVLSWPATVGRVYQVQRKDDPNQPDWIIGAEVTATDTTVDFIDSLSATPSRFYRVVLMP